MEKLNTAVIAVDMQRGFMPRERSPFLQMAGFAELPVEGGNETVQPANRLMATAAELGMLIATTQDWHPYETAHFAAGDDAPDFDTTWPRHCVGGSAGAELHPSLIVPEGSTRFIKGMEHMQPGDEDLSYSPFYAIDAKTGLSLPKWVAENEIDEVVIFGLALDKCV